MDECPPNRQWMYPKKYLGESISLELLHGIDQFDTIARMQPQYRIDKFQYRCPCNMCKNCKFQTSEVAKGHLQKKGFMENYWCWTHHGETYDNMGESSNHQMHVDHGESVNYDQSGFDQHQNHMSSMVQDAFQMNDVPMSENPNDQAATFYEMLQSAQQSLYHGCTLTELELAVRLLSIKSDWNIPQKCLDAILLLIRDVCPPLARIPKNFYGVMKNVKDLGMDMQSIDACINGCMIYYKDDENLEVCKHCGNDRRKPTTKRNKPAAYAKMQYLPLTPRLQRLYASNNTAQNMRWHSEHPRKDGIMHHARDGRAWKNFDKKYPDFANECRNVRLGLCSDGFTPYSNLAKSHSIWPIVLAPYNLPPSMCMSTPYMFLTCMIPGPKSPGQKIDVYMQPLIDELKRLWCEGVQTYDIYSNTNFIMRVVLMWTINDFPAYAMLSGWSTHGKLSCPVCMEQNPGTQLRHGKKSSWFDCHRCFLPSGHPYRLDIRSFTKGKAVTDGPPSRKGGGRIWNEVSALQKVTDGPLREIDGFKENEHHWTKQSIFWDLPYWRTHLLRHNLDVMHIEKNICDNIRNTVFDVESKTKDNPKARMDMAEMCDRVELNLVPMANNKYFKPKAKYTLTKEQRTACCEWLKKIELPDGYCSNFANCVDASNSKLQNMKSHDDHVFLETLLPMAFRALPEEVLGPLVELSEFFKNLCSSELHTSELQKMSKSIAVIICKLEAFFPPGFWNVMEHLPIHLAEEALLGGPVHYRWMYPFERFFGWLKKKCTQKSHPEMTMVNAYLMYEITKFSSFYFDPSVSCMRTRYPRNQFSNNDGCSDVRTLSVCHAKGKLVGPIYRDNPDDRDQKCLQLHILLNCEEVKPYLENFRAAVLHYNPNCRPEIIDKAIEDSFIEWFTTQVTHGGHQYLRDLSRGPVCYRHYGSYIREGVRFQTRERNAGKKTSNSGILVRGTAEGDFGMDYYGILEEILEVEYTGEPIKKVVLFKCLWFDPKEVYYDSMCPFDEVNPKKRLKKYDPFILADTAIQVAYLKYPEHIPRKGDVYVAVPNKMRGNPTGDDVIPIAFQGDYMISTTVEDHPELNVGLRHDQPDDVDDFVDIPQDSQYESDEKVEWQSDDGDDDDSE